MGLVGRLVPTVVPLEISQSVEVAPIDWPKIREIGEKAMREADEKFQKIIEGRAERLGLKIDYTSDDE